MAPTTDHRPPGRRLLRLGRRLALTLVIVWVLVAAAYLAVRHYVWPRIDTWRPRIAAQVGELVGHPVRLGRLEADFDGLLPRLVIDGIVLDDERGVPVLSAPRATLVISPIGMLTGRLRFSLLRVDGARVRVEHVAPQRLRVGGFDVALDGPMGARVPDWLLAQGRIELRGASVDWVDPARNLQRAIPAVDLSIGRGGRGNRVSLRAGPVEGLWARLEFAADFGAGRLPWAAVGPDAVSGEAYAGIDALDFAGLGEILDLPVTVPRAGDASLKTWVDFDGSGVLKTQLKASSPALLWHTADGERRVASVELEADLRPAPSLAGGELRVQRLIATLPGALRIAAAGEQRIRLDADWWPVEGRVALAHLDPSAALAFARTLPLPTHTRETLERLRVAGQVSAFSASWRSESAPGVDADAPAYTVSADFDGLSLRTEGATLPWFENLSGETRITPAGGELRLRSRAAVLGFPGIFAEPAIPLDTLRAQARWRLEPVDGRSEVRVDIAELAFANADAEGTLAGSYRTGGKGAGIVDLEGRLTRALAGRAARYLPLEIPTSVRDWVAAAVVGGRSDDVRLRLRGDLEDFPFRKPSEGDFSVHARLSGTTLRYAPGWPGIERFDGNLSFERSGMRVTMRSGRVFGVALGRTEAVLADFDRPLLLIRGAGEGPAADMIRFVNQSPLATRIDDFTRDVSAQGPAKLSLKLDLPLEDLDGTRVAGTVAFQRNALKLDKTLPPMSDVTGSLEFTEQGLALRGFSATLLGGSVRLDGQTPEPGRFVIRAEGTVPAEGLRSVDDNALTRALRGQAAYRANIEVRRRAASVTVESDLRGLASSLPWPFEKTESEAWPLRVSAVAEPAADPAARPSRDTIRVALRDDVRVAIERQRDPKSEKLLIRRAAFALDQGRTGASPAGARGGARTEPVMPDAGLGIQLNAARVDIDAWLALLGTADLRAAERPASEGFAEGFSLLPTRIAVVADRVRVAGKDLNSVVLGMTRRGTLWKADVASREISGFFSWEGASPGAASGTLTARFTRLEIPRSRAGEVESLLDRPPTELPALDIAADDFVLFDRHLGRLSLKATNSPDPARPGWALSALRIVNPSGTFSARGAWEPAARGAGRTTRLDFGLEIGDTGGLLAIYGLGNAMRAGAGRIDGSLVWRGSPLAIDYPTLGGTMKLDLGRGQFLRTDPGIAKLIGVLNLQSLPRRLTLDFRDVFAQGFAFDQITGEVGITAGVARTEDLLMRGVQAQVRIRGSADIAAETQALTVEVRPELNAGLASIAYGAMVNPVIGLGSFVAQMALSSPIQKIFTYEFDVNGSWADPQVVERRRLPSTTQAPTSPP